MTPAQKAVILKLARDAYRATGCEGFARVDFLLAGTELVVSEINTIPGFTPISLFPTSRQRRATTSPRSVAGSWTSRSSARRGRVRHRLSAADLPR